MKALVYHGPGRRTWEEKPEPAVQQPTDAVVRITHTTICGTDPHILKGDVPTCEPGRTLGHEGVGVVESGGVDAQSLITHHFPLKDVEKAYDVFEDAANEKAIKMILAA